MFDIVGDSSSSDVSCCEEYDGENEKSFSHGSWVKVLKVLNDGYYSLK